MNAETPDPQNRGEIMGTPSVPVPTLLQLVLFFVITFAVTWALFLPLVLRLFSRQSDEGNLLSLGIMAPTLTAFVLTALVSGRAGAGRLWRRGTHWRVAVRWYALVLGGPGLVYGACLAIGAALGIPAPAADLSSEALVSAVVAGLLAGISEEFGWSGFAFPALQARYGFLWAGVVVGLTVALWHLPFFFTPGLPHYSASFPLFLAAGIPLRTLFGWIYNGATGSVLLMILFHGSWNAWADILSPPLAVPEPSWLAFIAILWVAAGAVLLLRRGAAPRPAVV